MPAFPPAPPAESPQPKPKANSQSRSKRSPAQPPIKAKPPHRPTGPADISKPTPAHPDRLKKATTKAAGKAIPPQNTPSKASTPSAHKTQATLTTYQRPKQRSAYQDTEPTTPKTRMKRTPQGQTAYSPEAYGTAYEPTLEEDLDAEIEDPSTRPKKKRKSKE